MEYAVNMTLTAMDQMQQIARYIAQTLAAPETARRWANRLEEKILSLSAMPGRYPLMEGRWATDGVRKMAADHFLVYFWIDQDKSTVWVIAILYGKRDQLHALCDVPMK